MRAIRRLLQVVALVGTLFVGVVAVSLIVSQTPWFKDWLRRYIVRESAQFLEGDLSIGRLGGNLFFGVSLEEVAVNLSGERVVAVRTIEVDYSVFDFLSRGIVINEIKLHQPVVAASRDSDGWNLGRLIKSEEREADREGPGRPIALESIEITDGRVTIDDRAPAEGYRLPERIEGLNVRAAFHYEPVHYTVDLDHVGFRATGPELALETLSGTIAVRDDNFYIDQVAIRLTDTALNIDGVIEQYLSTPVLRLTTTGHLSLPEIGRVVPAAAEYPLHPRLDVRAEGPADRLALDLDVQSEAGHVRGQVTADVHAPDFAVRGDVAVASLDLAPILRDPAQRSDITGQAKIDLRMASGPDGAPAVDRLSGTFEFAGPRVVAAGYEARDVRATGSLAGSRINLDARAAAYGGTATARGFIVTPGNGRPLSFDLQGAADNVDLRGLPAATGAPQLATTLSVADYRIQAVGDTISGSARLNASTVEGARLEPGTTADFRVTPGAISYSARGQVFDLDLERMGRGLDIDALAQPGYASRLNGEFDVTGSMPRDERPPARRPAADEPDALSAMRLTASGTLRDSELFGGRLPEVVFDTTLDRGALDVQARGTFENFNPARFVERPELEGAVTGSLDVNVSVADLSAPITPEAVTAEGTVTLAPSVVGDFQIDSAHVDGRYANLGGEIATLELNGPNLTVEASGPIALDRQGQSALNYRVQVLDLAEAGRLAGQEGLEGIATVEGTVTGNASELAIGGILRGSSVSYQDNGALDLTSEFTVRLPELQTEGLRAEATTEATFLSVAGLEINAARATTTYVGDRVDFDAHLREENRELDVRGQVILHADHQEIHLPALAVRTQGLEWRNAPGVEATVQYGGGQIQIDDLHLVSGEQRLEVAGTIALAQDASDETPAAPPTGELRVQARNVDLQQLETLLLMDRGLTGRLSADATLTGSTDEPTVDGRVDIVDGGFQGYRYDSLAATVDYRGERIGIDATLQQSPTEAITAKGSVPVSLFQPSPGEHIPPAPGDEVDLHITSTAIDLGFVQGFTTAITNVTGTMHADLRVTGSGQDPHLDGFVDVRGGAFGVPLGGVSYTGLDTRIELAEDIVRIREFSILDEHDQPLTVSGELAVHAKQVGAVNITITSDNFELIDNELGDVGVDSQLRITGELRRPRIEGEIRLAAGRLEVDRILQAFYDPYAIEELPDVVSAERTIEGLGTAEEATRDALARARVSATPAGEDAAKAAVDAPETPGGLMDALAMDVRLRIPDNLVLRGRNLRPGGPAGASLGDMNITVGGDVQVRKQAGEPFLLVGVVNTVRGMYEFQGRRFELERDGTIRFTGSPEINPLLDITAARVIPNTGVEARIRITGTPAAPELALSSTPSLPESDILSLIVFNRQVNELGTGERSSLAATAGGIATGFIASPLGDSIGRALDLDLFEITTTTEEGELGAGITVGQQVGDRAFLKLRQQFGQRSLTEFILEYQLFDFLRLQATGAPESTGAGNRLNQRRVERGGVDLIFFFSY
jgi:autotransporter translocation and assembly factor TamB